MVRPRNSTEHHSHFTFCSQGCATPYADGLHSRCRGLPVVSAELFFRAMGSDAHVIVEGGCEQLADEARRRLFDLEQRWSRFLPHSEVNLLNDHAGEPVFVSAE